MSGGLRLHVALAAAGVLGGLPVAAVTQWLRPDPGAVWCRVPLMTEPPPQEPGGFEVGRLAIRPEGPGLTLCSVEVRDASWLGPEIRFHPALLNRAAKGVGLKPRWPPYSCFAISAERPGAGCTADPAADGARHPCQIDCIFAN